MYRRCIDLETLEALERAPRWRENYANCFCLALCAVLIGSSRAHDDDHASDWIGDHELKNANNVACWALHRSDASTGVAKRVKPTQALMAALCGDAKAGGSKMQPTAIPICSRPR